jgi:hypothetical protein
MNKLLLAAAGSAAILAAPAFAEPEYVTIPMEIDVDAPAAQVWSRIGGWCDIAKWAPQLTCEVTAGEGEIGSVRSLAGGRISEIMIAKTPLSYGYTQPAVEGQFFNMYHGFMEARPVTDTTSKILYTLFVDVSNLPDQAAKDADVANRRMRFEALLVTMKEMGEAAE